MFTKSAQIDGVGNGFSTVLASKMEKKVYEYLIGKDFLITSSETVFALDFCYEITLHCVHNNATFHGLENIYNQLHNYNRENIKKVDVNRKRLATAFFLYGFLEFSSRSGILVVMLETILKYYNLVKAKFSKHWTDKHLFDVANCETMMVSDGGMKIMRSVCAAKFSCVRKYSHSDKAVLTGCTASPSPNSPFCSEHRGCESPVLLAENLSLETRSRLREWRAKETSVHLPATGYSIHCSICFECKTRERAYRIFDQICWISRRSVMLGINKESARICCRIL